MEIQQLLRSNYLDILFDGRNKLYGSYELRRKYSVRTRKATTMVLLAAGIIVTLPVIASKLHPDLTTVLPPSTVVHVLENIPREKMPQPPLHVAPPPVRVVVADPIPTLIVPDEKVVEKPKVGEEVAHAEVGKEAMAGTLSIRPGSVAGDGNEKTGMPAVVETVVTAKPFTIVEQPPVFNGDIAAYLRSHLRYPESARQNSEEGQVILNFVVNEDGSISNVLVARAATPSLEAEAVRVVKSMPNWKPGRQAGKAVKVYFYLPVTFALD
jgi:protein TonB